MKPLRIVIVFLEPPLPFGAAVGRWFSVLLRELVARGHSVTAFAACSKPAEMEEAARLFPAPDYDLRLYPFPKRRGWTAKWQTLRRPYSYMFSEELQRDLDRVLESGFDVLHLEQPWSGWTGLRHPEKAYLSVLNLYSIDAEPARGLGAKLKRWLMLHAERKLLRSYRRFFTLSDRLRNEILRFHPAADVTVVPLGIDAGLYRFIPSERRAARPVISVIGNMGWLPSYSAAVRLLTRLWPAIKVQVPDAKVQIVGWQAKQALSHLVSDPAVSIEENVPDIQPYFEAAGVLLYAPSRGSGMKVKVLEAFAFGVPVVTNADGVEGLPAEDGVQAGIAEDDAGLIGRTVELLRDPAKQERQRQAARRLLETHCSPKATVDAVERTYSRGL